LSITLVSLTGSSFAISSEFHKTSNERVCVERKIQVSLLKNLYSVLNANAHIDGQ